jgi:hypothetical protein
MQHVDRALKLRDIQDSERSRFIANSYLLYALADAGHRLPIVRLTPALNLIELKASLAPRRTGKLAKIVQRRASELDPASSLNYTIFCIDCNPTLRSELPLIRVKISSRIPAKWD